VNNKRPYYWGFFIVYNNKEKRDRLGVGLIIAVWEALSRLEPSGVLIG
jgi:hypothetical protein